MSFTSFSEEESTYSSKTGSAGNCADFIKECLLGYMQLHGEDKLSITNRLEFQMNFITKENMSISASVEFNEGKFHLKYTSSKIQTETNNSSAKSIKKSSKKSLKSEDEEEKEEIVKEEKSRLLDSDDDEEIKALLNSRKKNIKKTLSKSDDESDKQKNEEEDEEEEKKKDSDDDSPIPVIPRKKPIRKNK